MHHHLETLKQFRQAIYESFPYRRDSLLELVDALSSNERAQSPVELSLNPCFRLQQLDDAPQALPCPLALPLP